MPTLTDIQDPIAQHLERYEEYLKQTMQSDNAYIAAISDYICSSRGKQMRPLLTLLTAALQAPEQLGERSYMGASLIELIHTASLIHDDVVDEAYMRRGMPSVHALWRSRTAVLIGDYIFSRSFYTCMEGGAYTLLREVTRAIYLVSEGELQQTEQSEKLTLTEPQYIEIIGKKTASLVAAAAAIGALSVDASAAAVEQMRGFGMELGLAFQIKDDILDYESSNVTGKPTCGDLRERKINLPLLYLLDQSSPVEREKLIQRLSDVRQHPKNVDYLAAAVVAGGGIEYAEKRMEEHRVRAIIHLSSYPISPVRTALELFADYVLQREK